MKVRSGARARAGGREGSARGIQNCTAEQSARLYHKFDSLKGNPKYILIFGSHTHSTNCWKTLWSIPYSHGYNIVHFRPKPS